MARLLSICGPEVWQKDFLIKRCVWITIFGEKRYSLTKGKAREAAVGIVLYKCSSHSASVTTLRRRWGLTVSREVPQHHSAGHSVDTETFAPNLIRYGSSINTSVGNSSTIRVKMLFPETLHLWRESRLQACLSSPENLGQSRN